MNNLINVTLNENQEPVVSARYLHKELKIKTRFSQWVDQNFKAFEENYDFSSVVITTQQNQYGGTKHLKEIFLAQKNISVVRFSNAEVEEAYSSWSRFTSEVFNALFN